MSGLGKSGPGTDLGDVHFALKNAKLPRKLRYLGRTRMA
jgi:hypothetical protein